MKPLSTLRLSLVVAGVFCLMVVLANFVARRVSLSSAPVTTATSRRPDIVVVPDGQGEGSAALRERAVLFGPASLFLPTSWTSSELELPSSARREPKASFPPTLPKFFHAESGVQVPIDDIAIVPSTVLAALDVGKAYPPFATLGQFETVSQPVAKRTLMVEAYDSKLGRLEYSKALLIPGAPSEINSDWKPMEMLVAVGASGQVGLPAIVQGTGSDLLDGFLLGYFSRQLPIALGLRPGFYTVRVGP